MELHVLCSEMFLLFTVKIETNIISCQFQNMSVSVSVSVVSETIHAKIDKLRYDIKVFLILLMKTATRQPLWPSG